MSLLLWAAIVCAGLLLVAAMGAWYGWCHSNAESRRLIKRIARLPFRRKLRLALNVARDRRIPLAVRGIPPGLILYLSMPIDIVPDFIPLLGQLDDVIVLIVGVGLLLRFTPAGVLSEHVGALEARD